MLNAFVWGFIAAFSLVIGGLIASWTTISQRTLGLIMAFGAGVLISAVSYELVFEAVSSAAVTGFPILGLFAGAATFFFSDRYVSGMVGSKADSAGSGEASSLVVPMVLGIVLDGIPESVALGLGLLKGGTISIAMLVAVFISNLPEAIAGTSGLKASGSSTVKTLSLWLLIALVCGGASAAGLDLRGRGHSHHAGELDDSRGLQVRREIGRSVAGAWLCGGSRRGGSRTPSRGLMRTGEHHRSPRYLVVTASSAVDLPRSRIPPKWNGPPVHRGGDLHRRKSEPILSSIVVTV
jgi:ZIP family zinc transporter